jgi:dGTPase
MGNLRQSGSAYELAAYAANAALGRGRQYDEPAVVGRSDYQRDRDRIIHSSAFRRLEGKTQVFITIEGDLYRTRLTHSLEVAQIARSIARRLYLNEDLIEAVSLAHDLGHTPFGHAGQDALNACMQSYGGFEHNVQSLRVVDHLEKRYAGFDGLNLCFETRESILKHCSAENARQLGDVAQRFIVRKRPLLEAQVANLADQIAYNNHDMDDGLRSGLITLEQACTVPLFKRFYDEVQHTYSGVSPQRSIHETVRRLINALIIDLLQETQRRLDRWRPQSMDDVRDFEPLVAFSDSMHADNQRLKRFLNSALYRHPTVLSTMEKAQVVVRELFAFFMDDIRRLPAEFASRAESYPARAVADYIAGMTDRYAIGEHQRLLGVSSWPNVSQ